MKKGSQTLSNHVKQGDMVKIISGKDKGKVGEITKIIKNENRVVVKEINIKRKHVKPRKEGDVGKISQSPLEDFTLTGLPSIKCLILLAIISPCLSKESPESKASKYSFKLVDGLIEKS